MPIVGTAGHVDHGKSTLVTALTGRDPDRWAEEKRRGLTIDLGFAWTRLGDIEVGFVDVPGHERFIKNMLAGAGGIDVALLVVAADEGWMPQTEEHVAVLDLLGVTRGVVAITRSDLVDADTVELVTLEVAERLEGTTLENAALVAVSAVTGAGLNELRAELASHVHSNAEDRGRPRLWVDRSFSVDGAGTVVTGTLVGGRLGTGSEVVMLPGGASARIRSIQSHERATDEGQPGNRVALALTGVARHAVPRGTLVGAPGQWRVSDRFLSRLRSVRGADSPRDRGAYHLHLGSGSWPARIRHVADDSYVITVADAIPVTHGDRFVLRDVGRRTVTAGGAVMDPQPPRRRRDLERTATLFGEHPPAEALLRSRGVVLADDLSADTGEADPPTNAVVAGRWLVDRSHLTTLVADAEDHVRGHHERHPLRAGIPTAELAQALGVPDEVVAAVVSHGDALADDGATVRLRSHQAAVDDDLDAIRPILADAGWAPPRRKDLPLDQETMHALVRTGRVVAVDEFVYLPETLERLSTQLVDRLADGFTVAEFRDAFAITRKHAIPLLEWLDSTGLTQRRGDGRVIRRSQLGEPGPGGVPSR